MTEDRLNVRNQGSSFCEFYELNGRYMFVLEEFSYTNNYINFFMTAPDYFFEQTVDSVDVFKPLPPSA